MKTKISKKLETSMIAVLILVATAASALGAMHDPPSCVANDATLQQLRDARRSTAPFNSVQAAEAANYAGPVIPVPNMGVHYVNGDLIDNIFDAENPEALVYADLGDGRTQLVAVEYLYPYSPSGPPEGFAGNCDSWSEFPTPDDPDTPEIEAVFWTLHAWIWQPNISGTFSKFNPLVP